MLPRRSARRGRPPAPLAARARRDFIQLFFYFLNRPVDVRPVEPDAGGAVLQTKRAVQRRQVDGQSVDDARPRCFAFICSHGCLRAVAVEVRMPRLSSS